MHSFSSKNVLIWFISHVTLNRKKTFGRIRCTKKLEQKINFVASSLEEISKKRTKD